MPETSNYQKHMSKNPLQKFLIENFYKSLVSFAKSVRPVTVLDVGCGEGFSLVSLRRSKIGKVYEGVDYSYDAIRLGKKLYPKLNIKLGNIYDLPYKDSVYDLVICTEVLEHLEKPHEALSEIKRVAKKYIILSVPNEPFFTLGNLFRGKYIKSFGNNPEHINHWNAGGFGKFLRSGGLKISGARYPFPWTVILARK